MKCENLQFNLSLYSDDVLSDEERAGLDEHLTRCPLCRQKRDDFQAVRQTLRSMPRPEMPRNLLFSVKDAMRAELAPPAKRTRSIFSANFLEFLQMRVMPVTVGTVASFVFGFSLLWAMLSGINAPPDNQQITRFTTPDSLPFMLPKRPRSDDELTPADFAAERVSVAGESPSLNPQGALVAMTTSFVRGKTRADELVVVADVFSNGLANIEEVVEPLDNQQTVNELEKAFNQNSPDAPFVPAFLDGRADSVRVVLKIQRVDVVTSLPKNKRK